MPERAGLRLTFHFGAFRLDAEAGELREGSKRVKLQEQPFQILLILLERHGEIVTRDELRNKLWGPSTFVDFENGLNIAVRKLRSALGDDPEAPRYIETVPRRGYRFIAEVKTEELREQAGTRTLVTPSQADEGNAPPSLSPRAIRSHKRVVVWAAIVLLALFAIWAPVVLRRRNAPSAKKSAIHSIAVLPLQNLSGDPAQEYFADGMTEELITDLAQIKSLHVISRTSSMLYKGSHKSLREIGRELGVHAVVEGAVVRDGNRVRITAQMIQASTDTHLWASSYERDISDVLSVQREIAQDIAREVRSNLSPEEQIALTKHRPVNPEAYEAYLKGRYYSHQLTEEGLGKSIEFFRRAVVLDPNYAPTYAGIAYYYFGQAGWGLSSREAMPKAEEAAAKAIELDDSLPEAHMDLAVVHFLYRWDWSSAEREFRRAIELGPGDALVHQIYGSCLVWAGRSDEGIAEGQHALALDPVSAETSGFLADDYYFAHRYAQAVAQGRETLQLQPDYWFAHLRLGRAYLQTGDSQHALSELETAARLQPEVSETLAALAYVEARLGQRSATDAALRTLLTRSHQAYVDPYHLAVAYTGIGRKDEAFDWLDRAYEERSQYLTWLQTDPVLDPLRADRRFSMLLRRVSPAQ